MNGQRNPILIGQAEAIDQVRPDVRAMLNVDGFYIATDTAQPGPEVPLVVMQGRVWCMTLDTELRPDRFLPTVQLVGPFRGGCAPPIVNTEAPVAAVDKVLALMEDLARTEAANGDGRALRFVQRYGPRVRDAFVPVESLGRA